MKATIKIEGDTFSDIGTAINVVLDHLKKQFKKTPHADLADLRKSARGYDFSDDNCYGSVEMKIRRK